MMMEPQAALSTQGAGNASSPPPGSENTNPTTTTTLTPFSTTTHETDGENNNRSPLGNPDRNVVNESFHELSRFQKILMLMYLTYFILWRMAGHVQLLRAGYKHFYDHWHLLAFWSDLSRLIICLGMELWAMSHVGHSTTSSLLTSFWQSFQQAWFGMAFSFLLSWGHEFAMKQAIADIPYAIAEVGTFGVLPGVAVLSMVSRMKYSYTPQQWGCMIAVVVGAYIMQVHGIQSEHDGFGSRLAGLVFILMGVLTESLFVVFTEEIFKADLWEQSDTAPSLWMRGIQFSLTGVIVRPIIDRDWTAKDMEDTAMTFATYLLAPLTGGAILIIFALLKHVTAVHEKLTLFFAYACANLLDYWLFGSEMTRTWVLYFGTTIMISSICLFGSSLPDWASRLIRLGNYQEISSTAATNPVFSSPSYEGTAAVQSSVI